MKSLEEEISEGEIFAEGPFLVIYPPGMARISFDTRILDRIEVVRKSVVAPGIGFGMALAGGVAAGAIGGTFVSGTLLLLAGERALAIRKRLKEKDLLLVIDDLEVALQISERAQELVESLGKYTKDMPIRTPDEYLDAKARLASCVKDDVISGEKVQRGLNVGNDEVVLRGKVLEIGPISFRVEQVEEYAMRGANLPLPGGRRLQAAMALLLVAAKEQWERGENTNLLAKRIAEYEEWTGHMPQR